MTQNWRERRHLEGGMLLPEVLLSSAIGLIAIAAILTAFVSWRFAAQNVQHWTQAANVARTRLECLKSLQYTSLSTMPAVTPEYGLVLDQAPNGNFIACDRTTVLEEEGEGITVVVAVSWQERTASSTSRRQSYDFKTWVGSPRRTSFP